VPAHEGRFRAGVGGGRMGELELQLLLVLSWESAARWCEGHWCYASFEWRKERRRIRISFLALNGQWISS
jgi:hypothetical protein